MDALTQEVLYMETQTWEALKISGSELVPFLAPDCVMIFPGGAIFDASSTPSLNDILTRQDMKPWTQYKISDVHVLNLGQEAASISYSVEAWRHDTAYEALITSIWRRAGNSWQLVLHQQTPSPL